MEMTTVALVFGGLVVGALLATFVIMARASKGYEKARQRRQSGAPERACSACRARSEYNGIVEYQGPEGTVTAYEAYLCPICRKVDHVAPPASIA